MKIVSLAKVKARLSAYIEAARSGPIVITKNGSATAVLLAVDNDDELERLLLAHSPKLRRILQKSAKSIRSGRGIPHEDFWAEVAEL
jgi:prevent-host-death family protein